MIETAAPPKRHRHVLGVVLLILLAVSLTATQGPLSQVGLTTGTADAGVYNVGYCGNDGVAENWTSYATGPGTSANECGPGGRLRATLSGTGAWGEGSEARLNFSAPDGTTIAAWQPRLRYTASKSTDNSERMIFTAGSASNPSVRCLNLECGGGNGAWDTVAVPAGTRQLQARAICAAERPDYDLCQFNVDVSDYGGTITLQDDSAPRPRGGVTGPLTGAVTPRTAASGTTSIAGLVDDTGSGIQSLALQVDGATVATGPSCTAQPTTKVVPCPLTQNADITLDSRNLSDGGHAAKLVATDAAGNQTTIWEKRIFVANTPIGPGSSDELRGAASAPGATDDARITATWPSTAKRPSRRCKSASFRRRHRTSCKTKPASTLWKGSYAQDAGVTVTGRVTNKSTKAAIPGAPVTLLATPIRGAGAPIRLTGTTNENGRYSFKLPRAQGSHNVRISFLARENDVRPAATAKARQLVRSTMRLRVNRKAVRSGRSVTFSASLRDRAPGVPAVLEVFAAGKWRVFAATSTNSRGRFRASYRFVGGRGSYRFRARARPTSSTPWPYLGSPSQVVRVRVR